MTAPPADTSQKWLPLVLAFITGVTSAGGIGIFVTRDLATNADVHELGAQVEAIQIEISRIRERQNINSDAIAALNQVADELADRITELVTQLPNGNP